MFPITDPTWIFFIVLGVILFAPMIMGKLHIPSLVGLIAAGVCIGPHGFHVLDYDESFKLFGKVGIYYIMFLASLEMNVQDIRKVKGQTALLGLLSFAFPFGIGLLFNLGWGFSLTAAVLMAAMYASHTLISYPIVLRYGLSRQQSVSIATGGTIIADVLTLLVLAVIGGTFKVEVSGWYLAWLILKVFLIGGGIIFFFPRMGHWFFKRHDDGVVQYIFVLALVFLGASLMELVEIEGILGAFLVGIVLNRLIPPSSPLMSHIEFIGNSIFIPYFLIGVGMIINVRAFLDWQHTLPLAAIMVAVACSGKWLATLVTQKTYHMTVADRNLMFGLTTSRAAATLAVVLVGYGIILPDGNRLLSDVVLNATMLLILATCIISSFVTERTARSIAMDTRRAAESNATATKEQILIALSNPDNVAPLVNAALTLRSQRKSTLLSAIYIVLENDSELRQEGTKILEAATKITAAANVNLTTYNRWAVNVASGIYHTMMETSASDLLIGMHQKARIGETFYGKITNDLLTAVQQQIILYRQILPLNTVRRIHLLVPRRAEFEQGFEHWANRVAQFNEQLGCRMEIYGNTKTLEALKQHWQKKQASVRVEEWVEYNAWHDLSTIVHRTRQDHLMIFIMARHDTLSYHKYMERLPDQMERYFSTRNLMIVFPNQYTGSLTSTSARSGVPVKVR